ncbi:hypothetical protein [Bradyrhizobium guangzhouense]|uniref:hypothetical protein n=1 Tax=Bradyrhizobium guangzhouense TaxID=1325095 RepID=UPI0010098C90|nr:hypothetical protein [Bradyrhizobium guangzhouense]RXH05692.1 hypothetical protein EAS54_38965 [Bradyrhizobium guangzhouense]
MIDGPRLPKGVQAKILRLADAEAQAQALISSTLRRIGELQRMLSNNLNAERAEACLEEIGLLRQKQEQHSDRHRECADVNAAISRYLAQIPANVFLSDAKRGKAKLKAGETHAVAVDRVRGEIATVVSERQRVQQAGLPIADIRAKAAQWIDQRRRFARPKLTVSHDQFDVRFDLYIDNSSVPVPDMAGMMAYLFPERFAKRLDELISEMPEPAFALTVEEKSARLKDIRARLYELEVEEEALISAADELGQIIPRRSTADPRAILGLEINREAKAA